MGMFLWNALASKKFYLKRKGNGHTDLRQTVFEKQSFYYSALIQYLETYIYFCPVSCKKKLLAPKLLVLACSSFLNSGKSDHFNSAYDH